MSTGRFSRAWNRAAERWDKTRVPPPLEDGERWMRITVDDMPVGIHRRRIVEHEGHLLIEVLVVVKDAEQVESLSTETVVVPWPEPRWVEYRFASPTARLHLLRDGDQLTVHREDVDPDEPITIPSSAAPAFGAYHLVTSLPFEAGRLKSFGLLDDGDGHLIGDSSLVSIGWDEDVNPQWWRIDQYWDGSVQVQYWLDSQHRMMKADWGGAMLNLVADQDEAVLNLPQDVIDAIPE